MSKEDKAKKKEHHEKSPVVDVNGQASGPDDEKDHARKDKKHQGESFEEKEKQWQSKYDELNDKYLRLYSDFDNYRKRTQKERIELSKTASEEIILNLLPVIDDLERALSLAVKNSNDIDMIPKEGIELIYQKFKNILVQKGLEPIQAIGGTFDVDYHDAITNIPAPAENMKGKVVDEVEKGYMLNGKVIRYSKVVVGN
jgi:molecular chaperone GrpE